MDDNTPELDQLQNTYKAAVERWIVAIKQEELLASVNHSIVQVLTLPASILLSGALYFLLAKTF
jgi:hypothetical protein